MPRAAAKRMGSGNETTVRYSNNGAITIQSPNWDQFYQFLNHLRTGSTAQSNLPANLVQPIGSTTGTATGQHRGRKWSKAQREAARQRALQRTGQTTTRATGRRKPQQKTMAAGGVSGA